MEFSHNLCYSACRFHEVITSRSDEYAVKGLASCQPFYYLESSVVRWRGFFGNRYGNCKVMGCGGIASAVQIRNFIRLKRALLVEIVQGFGQVKSVNHYRKDKDVVRW